MEPSALAVIVPEPFDFDVTLPFASIDATLGAELASVSAIPSTDAPVRATMWAVTVCVSFRDLKVSAAGLRSM